MKIPRTIMLGGCLLLVLWQCQVFGQSDLSVVGSCGDRLVSTNMLLDWTLGEAVVSTVTSPTRMLSQGFHQPSVDTVVVTISEVLLGSLSVAPNPSMGMIMLNVIDWPNALLQVQVSDATGTVVMQMDEVTSDGTLIDLSPFSDGIYTIRVYCSMDNSQQLFRILKCN